LVLFIFSFFITSFVRHLEYYNLYFIKCNGSIYLFQVGSIRYTGWRLTRRVGIFFLISYAVYVLFSVMIECNVFGFVNPPMCNE